MATVMPLPCVWLTVPDAAEPPDVELPFSSLLLFPH
jgi:hypothetical protein